MRHVQAAAKPQYQTKADADAERAQRYAEQSDPAPASQQLEIVDDEDGTYLVLEDADLEFFAGSANDRADPRTPESWLEAMRGPDRDKWIAGLNEELSSLAANNVYEVVPIPDGVVPITSKPGLEIKLNAAGQIERYKVHIVARGFTQRAGVDYQDVFAPVANLESIRII
jgi:hypothetical protein